MKRRIARKILKRIGHHVTVVGGRRADLTRPNSYKRGTVNQAIIAIYPTIDLTPGTLAYPKRFGLLDQDTDTWMGLDAGPLTYDDYDLARIAARLLAARMNWSPLRIEVKRYTKATVKLDDIKPVFTLDEAWRRIDEGIIL